MGWETAENLEKKNVLAYSWLNRFTMLVSLYIEKSCAMVFQNEEILLVTDLLYIMMKRFDGLNAELAQMVHVITSR